MIINYSIQWYIFIQLLAIIAFILTFKTFSNLKDQGYTISKTLGLIIASLLTWVIISYSGKSLEFTSSITYISTGILGAISLIFLFTVYKKEDRQALFYFIDKRYKLIFITEALFIGILILGAYIRGFNPDILGINKLQEYVYINSILNTNSLPAENLWFSGYKLNLPYYGYFMIAFMVKLSKIPLEYAFNLVPSTIIALISITSAGLLYNITKLKSYAILCAILTALGGNYIALRDLISKGIENGFSWWDSAHFLPNNLFTEFPFWSLILGDIEPFFISSFLILALVYLIHALNQRDNLFLYSQSSIEKSILWILIIITSTVTILTNILTLPIVIILILSGTVKPLFANSQKKPTLKHFITTTITCIIAIIIISIPFISSYLIPYTGIGLIKKGETISFTNFILMSGAFILPVIILITIEIKEILNSNWKTIILIGISALSVIEIILVYKSNLYPGWLWVIISIPLVIITTASVKVITNNNNTPEFRKKLSLLAAIFVVLTVLLLIANNPVTLFAIILTVFSIYILSKSENTTSSINGILLFAASLSLLLADTFYLKIDDGNYNTTSSYLLIQFILLLPVIATISIFIIFNNIKSRYKNILSTVLTLIILPCFIFTILAPYYRTNKFNFVEGLVPNLSGINHMEAFHKPDAESIEWIKWNTPKDSIILETIVPGELYHGRITGYSGRKALLAWPGSKLFTYGPKVKEKLSIIENDINKIYEEKDKTRILDLLNKYSIEYIYIGELEKKRYPKESLEGFNEIATLEFQASSDDSCKVYKLKRNPVN